MSELAYIGIGSNLGDRMFELESSIAELAAFPEITIEAISSVYETAPLGYVDQPDFLNAVFSAHVSLPPFALLRLLRGIEDRHHRTRDIRWGPRTLDMDLLLYGTRQMCTEELVLPHPWMHKRGFVLVPLCEIAPSLRHPVTGRLFSDYLRSLEEGREVRWKGALSLPHPD